MTTELMTRASALPLMRRQNGELLFPRFTTLAGVRYVDEMTREKDVVRISVDEFARAFHGIASSSNRRKSKPQLRQLYKTFLEDGQMVVPEYADDGKLVGLLCVRALPDDPTDILSHIAACMSRAKRQQFAGEQQERHLEIARANLLREPCDSKGETP